MAEFTKMNNMDSNPLSSSIEPCNLEEMGAQKISFSDQTNVLQYSKIKSDSFIVDMEHFSHPTDKNLNANSRISKMQRSLSRKGSQRGGEKRMTSSNNGRERDNSVVATSSPKATLSGSSTPEKSMVVTVGATDNNPINPQNQHQITIMTANGGAAAATESKLGGKRFSFRRSPQSWAIDPRRILIFFATLSSMGSILLIYFTLSMSKFSEDDIALND